MSFHAGWLGTLGDIAKVAIPAISQYKSQEFERDMIKMRLEMQPQPQQYYAPQPQQRAPQYAVPQSLPLLGSAPLQPSGGSMPQYYSQAPTVMQAGLDIPGMDIAPQGGAALFSPFLPTMAGARAQAFVATNPMSGRLTWFKPAGRPILWSGDLAATKRVRKIAARARRSR